MKIKINVTLLLCILAFQPLNARTFFRAAIFAKSSVAATTALVSQSVTASTWLDGEYAFFKRQGDILVKQTEKRKLTFTKNEKGEVIEFTLDDLTYRGDESGKSEFVRYFQSDNGYCLYFTPKTIYQFESPGSTTIKGSIGAKGNIAARTTIETFLTESVVMQEEDIKKYNEKMAEEARLAQLEKEKKFSIKDKEVSKLEIVNIVIPEKFGHYVGFTYDIKATLKDGSVLSTDNGGFRSDYEITYVGGEYTDGKIQGTFIKDDKITITVVSKFNPADKVTADVVVLYNQDISFNYTATGWSRSAGESANNFKIEVKQVKHKVNGTLLNAVRITNVTTGTVVAQFKIGVDQTLHFYCNGGYGGSDDGYGKDGGNGGNLTVIKDPSVKTFNLDYSNRGGKAGKGTTSSYDGRAGRDGEYIQESAAVTFPL
ncbi:MAG: hypothetical protein HYZ14_08580 [Bacteroidetes bacterium]|nr:hypothetical protein [Bacteroidota bacterium]